MLGMDLCRDVLGLEDMVRGGLGMIEVTLGGLEVGVGVGNGWIGSLLRCSILARAVLRRWRARAAGQTLCSSRGTLGGVGESTSRPTRSPIGLW